jgi:N-acetylglutamate synthase-like GNAT family acetyltransferase
MTAIVPIPRCDVSVREATLADVAFIDRLQKLHADRVGFMRTSWIEEKIDKGEVIVAEEPPPLPSPASGGGMGGGRPVGYCMGVDRYFKRDDVGIIYQLNVEPGRQRGYVGMALLKAMFDRAAYGCRLFCCWCAQDIEANKFWESMGFVPLAYRAGSEKKGRVHIFWQKRIREGDTGQGGTPWWFPAKTDAGAMGADRIVLPIPPGKHWADEMPVILPPEGNRKLEIRNSKQIQNSKSKIQNRPMPVSRKLWFAPAVPPPSEKKPREKKPKVKADPKLVAAARELRDRWLEHVNAGEMLLESAGKYDVSRALPDAPKSLKALRHAA